MQYTNYLNFSTYPLPWIYVDRLQAGLQAGGGGEQREMYGKLTHFCGHTDWSGVVDPNLHSDSLSHFYGHHSHLIMFRHRKII